MACITAIKAACAKLALKWRRLTLGTSTEGDEILRLRRNPWLLRRCEQNGEPISAPRNVPGTRYS